MQRRNPQTRRFADVPGTHRPRPDREHLKALRETPREPCRHCASVRSVHLPGCPQEFGF